MINVFHTDCQTPLTGNQWQYYLSILPQSQQIKIKRFKKAQDQQLSLFSKLLLQHVLHFFGYDLQQLQYTQYGKPFIEAEVDFNLAHSQNKIVCAVTTNWRVGIDIEFIKPVNLTHFRDYLTPQQWLSVTTPHWSYQQFYHYWTIKESVVKADGRGLSVLQEVHIRDYQATLTHHLWYIVPIMIDADYVCHLATNCIAPMVTVQKVIFAK